jgi:hypothetical protein
MFHPFGGFVNAWRVANNGYPGVALQELAGSLHPPVLHARWWNTHKNAGEGFKAKAAVGTA